MGRMNATFRYRNPTEPTKDENTGFVTGGSQSSEWVDGGRCQLDKSVPARQVIGTDGQMHSYTYDLFIPRPFHDASNLTIGTEVEVTMEDGTVDQFTSDGVDNQNRKYVELWG